jgi:Subtilase family/Purple acid Phosphatase, N-terminal domain
MSGLFVRRVCSLILVCLFYSGFVSDSPAKPIRLSNDDLAQKAVAREKQTRVVSAPATRLFVVQFQGPLKPEWRQQLRMLGVDLLRYVPDDAFVTRFENVSPAQVRALSFVVSVNEYRAEHKVRRDLLPGVAKAAGQTVDVSVLLSPHATESDAVEVKRSLKSVGQESNNRFGRVIRGKLDATQLEALARSDAVLWIEPLRPMKLFDEVSSRIVGGDGPPGQTLVQSRGYNGAGVTVAVTDSGLDSGDTNHMHLDIQGRVKGLFFYGSLADAADEHGHGTHCAGIIAGNGALGETDENGFLYGLGVAPGASVIAQRIFDADGNFEAPASFETLTRDAKRAGADIGSNSWGDDTQGRYDISAMEFDALVRDADALALGDQQYILEFSAGNAGPGPQTVGSPAVAKNVIATGAANSNRRNLPIEEFTIYDTGPDTMADFSSRGPCADGRIKPDLVAPGTWIASLRSIYANDSFAWWPISDNYFYEGGTSQAGPHVSGAAAVFVQYYRDTHSGATPSPALVKAALINSAADMDNSQDTGPVPNMDEGWGRVDLPALVASTRNYDFVDQTTLLTNGGVYEKRVLIGSSDEQLKITLAYTDVPGLPAAVVALVNDLDLEVQSPDGHLYRGNQFLEGESVPDPTVSDTINNVEAVHLHAPVPGEYLIRVRGANVVEDARQDTPGVDQDFALVVSGHFAAPGAGIVTFDRPVYRAPDKIKLTLADYDLAGQSSANILLRSRTEPAGESITLQANGSSGLFTGVVATATGPAVTDGKLQISHGDTVEAVYADALPPANRVFTARADLLPPVISNVLGANQFGQVVISWTTDEDARSFLFYGTNTPNLGLTNNVLDVSHEFSLPNIAPNSVVKFFVVAEDEAGNRATNDNGGAHFTVVNTQLPSILLVDSFADYFGLLQPPPLSGYTDALDAMGAVYNVFDATTGAEPTLAQLQSYRCVIWRISDLDSPSLTLAQKITDYVHGGGSLLIASMDAVTRFTEAGLSSFNTGILQVQSYIEDQPVNDIAGAPGDPVSAGINTTLDYTPYSDILAIVGTSDPSDWLVPNTNASPIIESDGLIVGIRSPKTGIDLPGRVVFLSFPLDAVPMTSGVGNNRAGLLRNIVDFLAPPPGSSALTLDSDVYSVPGRAVVEVEDLDSQGQGQTSVSISNLVHGDTINVALAETVRRGLFRGSFVLVPSNTGAPGTLFVQSGDTVEVDYVKPSSGQTISATATIDTNAPVISKVNIEPGYLEALVSWDTSKDADSLVQYGTSSNTFPVNFTAYDNTPTTFHELLLTGLQPNRTYYVRVAGRDRAGNSTLDDNGGRFYTFTTLQPMLPPWQDDLEIPGVDWSTDAAAESESQWTLGTPGGGRTAQSGTNCWGSNLSGGPLGGAECFLYSPGILITGGNRATLRFWHNYDFTTPPDDLLDFEDGTVEIITNISTASVLLKEFKQETFSDGWEEVQLDLTPYMGSVVYIKWYYFFFSAGDMPLKPGWLVDDVSITVDTIVPGTVTIINNLWQAVFALSGPTGLTGHGRWTVITNAPSGQYVVQFGDVPYHTTPPPQTNTLAAGGQITFQGNYTFTDANANGIPDPWELEKFGVVDPQRTMFTDTDHDGMSDWAEFVAGTDPNNPPPPFRLTARLLANGLVQLGWPSVTNHTYRVHSSTNATTWSAFSDWLPAAGTNTAFTLPTSTNGSPYLFRVEAEPPTGPNATASLFRVNANVLTNGQVRLDWPSAAGHGYRVLGSTDATSWAAVSDWIRASGNSTGLTLSSATNGSPYLFRVEAQP